MKAGSLTDRTPSQAPHPVVDRVPGAHAVMDRLGYTCLDEVWKGAQASYRFRCRHGHAFARQWPALFKPGHRCPGCMQHARTERLHALSQAAGVTCLEPAWLGADALHRFQCPAGHTWQCLGNLVTLGHAGCTARGREATRLSQCSPDGLERLRQFAAEHGGTCLAERYEGIKHLYAFRCAQGHTWQTTGNYVLYNKTWCTTCAYQRMGEQKRSSDGLVRLQAQAQRRGGQCLSAV